VRSSRVHEDEGVQRGREAYEEMGDGVEKGGGEGLEQGIWKTRTTSNQSIFPRTLTQPIITPPPCTYIQLLSTTGTARTLTTTTPTRLTDPAIAATPTSLKKEREKVTPPTSLHQVFLLPHPVLQTGAH
jgi:hypothetical protein